MDANKSTLHGSQDVMVLEEVTTCWSSLRNGSADANLIESVHQENMHLIQDSLTHAGLIAPEQAPDEIASHLHKSDAQTFSFENPAIEALRRNSTTSIGPERRNSLTPESPYMVSDETRARDNLLESDMETQQTPEASRDSPSHKSNVVTQAVGKASELMGEVAGILAGVVPGSMSPPRHHPEDESVEFFVSSPTRDRRNSLIRSCGTGSEERRVSLTPESPYQLSDETRSRKENLDSDPPADQSFLETRRGSVGSASAKYERME